jgi:hypothetical protein
MNASYQTKPNVAWIYTPTLSGLHALIQTRLPPATALKRLCNYHRNTGPSKRLNSHTLILLRRLHSQDPHMLPLSFARPPVALMKLLYAASKSSRVIQTSDLA